jgi:hypothetical protein
MQHYDVLIATPGTKLEADYVDSLVKTLEECGKKNISYRWLNGKSSLVHHARELTATGGDGFTLNPNHKGPLGDSITYNKIFWIDSDIQWKPEDFFKLYYSDLEVVSGAYLLANGKTTAVHLINSQLPLSKKDAMKMKDVCQAQTIGFGFVAVKSGVFEKIERPWFSHLSQEITNDLGIKIYDSVGEDISWCIKASNCGVPIYFDPSVLVNHIKTVQITWDN